MFLESNSEYFFLCSLMFSNWTLSWMFFNLFYKLIQLCNYFTDINWNVFNNFLFFYTLLVSESNSVYDSIFRITFQKISTNDIIERADIGKLNENISREMSYDFRTQVFFTPAKNLRNIWYIIPQSMIWEGWNIGL